MKIKTGAGVRSAETGLHAYWADNLYSIGDVDLKHHQDTLQLTLSISYSSNNAQQKMTVQQLQTYLDRLASAYRLIYEVGQAQEIVSGLLNPDHALDHALRVASLKTSRASHVPRLVLLN